MRYCGRSHVALGEQEPDRSGVASRHCCGLDRRGGGVLERDQHQLYVAAALLRAQHRHHALDIDCATKRQGQAGLWAKQRWAEQLHRRDPAPCRLLHCQLSDRGLEQLRARPAIPPEAQPRQADAEADPRSRRPAPRLADSSAPERRTNVARHGACGFPAPACIAAAATNARPPSSLEVEAATQSARG